jgi:hypothetical protein
VLRVCGVRGGLAQPPAQALGVCVVLTSGGVWVWQAGSYCWCRWTWSLVCGSGRQMTQPPTQVLSPFYVGVKAAAGAFGADEWRASYRYGVFRSNSTPAVVVKPSGQLPC